MSENKLFPGAQEQIKNIGYKDPTAQAMLGIHPDEATRDSEASFEKLEGDKVITDAESITEMAADAEKTGRVAIHGTQAKDLIK